MKVSVVFSTFNRGFLLDRSLFTYTCQSLKKRDYELIIIDDQSTDETKNIVEKYLNKLNIIYIQILGDKKNFRAQSMGWNIGLALAIGEVCFFSHPELMMPKNTLESMYEPHARFNTPTFLTMKPYVLSQKCMEKLETIDWRSDLENIKTLREFSDTWIASNKIHTNEYMEKITKWESNTTFSMKRIDLLGIGGFDEFDCWGPDDPSFCDRRKKLKIPTIVSNIMNYHQNHDNISSSERSKKYKCKKYFFPSSAKLKAKDHLGEYEVMFAYRPT